MTENYTDETIAYVKAVRAYLEETYGSIKDSWKPLIKMLATEYDLYSMAQVAIKANGILVPGPKDSQIANPAIKVSHDALVQINKLTQELGITPKIEAKLKLSNIKDDTDDFLDNLIK